MVYFLFPNGGYFLDDSRMLKYTSINLDLHTDYEKLLMIEQGIRGGLVQASMRYAKANNYKTPTFDNEKPKSWLIYQDCKLFLFNFLNSF